MRRVLSVALFVLLAVFLVQAQMRGGHGGGGGGVYRGGGGGFHGAPGGGFHGAPGGGYHGGGYHPGPGYGGIVKTQVPSRWHGGGWGGGSSWGFGVGFGYGGGYVSGGYGHGYGYGWGPYRHHRYPYYPYYGYGYYAPYAYGYPYVYAYPSMSYSVYDPGAYTYYSNNDASYYAQQQAQLNAEIGSLNQQMQDLRQENDNLRDYVQRSNPAPAQGPDRRLPQSLNQPMNREPVATPPTILVFHDGSRVEVRNYAIVGKTIWSLSETRSEKYPLADLDVDKTVQVNEQRGIEFTPPPSNQ